MICAVHNIRLSDCCRFYLLHNFDDCLLKQLATFPFSFSRSSFSFSYGTASKKLNVASAVLNSKGQLGRIFKKKTVTKEH